MTYLMHFRAPAMRGAVALLLLLLLSGGALAQNTQLVVDQAATLPSLATPGQGTIDDLQEYTDAQGNTYQAGSFYGTVHFGPFTFTAGTEDDVVVAKRNAAGVYQWALAGGGAGEQRCKALAVDAAGNVYLTGSFDSPTATFGPTVLTNRAAAGTSTSDVFACRVTAAGAWDWAVGAGGGTRIDGNDYGTAIAVDAFGNAYVAGTFTSSVAFFGSIQVPSPDPIGRNIVFVAKLSAGGIWQWVSNGNAPGNIPSHLIAEPGGATYLSGEAGGYLSYGPFLLLNPGGRQVSFVAKLDPAGAWVWLTKSVASRSRVGLSQHFGLVLDNRNSAYMTGVFSCDTLRFGTTALANSGPLAAPGFTSRTYDTYLAKLNLSTGQWRWAVQSRGRGDESVGVPLLDGLGRLYVGGGFSELPGGGGPGGSQYGATTLVSAGGLDMLVAQLDTAGQWLWARRAGGPDSEGGGPKYLDAQGRVVITGFFRGATLPLGSFSLVALPTADIGGQYSAFEARLGTNGPLAARPGSAGADWTVYPNPARGVMTVAGLPAGQAVVLLDVLGREVLRGTAPARGDLRLCLPPGLANGLYVVRAGTQAKQVVVE